MNAFQKSILGFTPKAVITEDNEIEAIWYVILRGQVLLPRDTRFRNGTLAGVYSLLVAEGFFVRTVEPPVGRRPSAYRFAFTQKGLTAFANLRKDPEMDEIYRWLRFGPSLGKPPAEEAQKD